MTETEQWTLKEQMLWEAHTKFWRTYINIKSRCNNPIHAYYYLYWWKWIICEWNSYKSFRDDMYESYLEHCKKYWEKNTTIDRIDSNWNYCKWNCRWATKIEQWRNTNRNHRFEWNWEMLTLREIYDKSKTNIAYKTFAWRVYSKWMNVYDAISIPYVKWFKNKLLHINI